MKKIILLFLILQNIACFYAQNTSKPTPKEFKWNRIVSKEAYEADSTDIGIDLNSQAKKHEPIFYSYTPKDVDTLKTKVEIDTIVFNLNSDKAFILLTIEFYKYHHYKDVNGVFGDSGTATIFDGNGILAKKINGKWIYHNYWVIAGNYDDKVRCKKRLREMYFLELTSHNMKSNVHYNIDDSRIWSQEIWNNF